MQYGETLAQKAKRHSRMRFVKRSLLRLAALAALLGAAYYVLSDRVPFLMSIDGVVVDRKIRRVHVVDGHDSPSTQDRYYITVKSRDGELVEISVSYEVFVRAKEGTPIVKHPFSNRYSFE